MSVFLDCNGSWNKEIPVIDENGNEGFQYETVLITDVPVACLLQEWEDLVNELSHKEVELVNVREEHNRKEFEILTTFDFKKVYGKDNEKIRKAHVHNELFDLDKSISDLELSINWIKGYVPLLRECIKCKRD